MPYVTFSVRCPALRKGQQSESLFSTRFFQCFSESVHFGLGSMPPTQLLPPNGGAVHKQHVEEDRAGREDLPGPWKGQNQPAVTALNADRVRRRGQAAPLNQTRAPSQASRASLLRHGPM